MFVKDVFTLKYENICKKRGISISRVIPSAAYSMMDKNRRNISAITVKKFWN